MGALKNMARFEERLQAREEWERVVYTRLQSHPQVIRVCFNGTEHTHPDFVSLLRFTNKHGARLLRFQPDGVMLMDDDTVIHFDAKRAKAIERTAWGVYHSIEALGARVMIFVKHPDTSKEYWQYLPKIRLIPGDETVARFPVHDGWIVPPDTARTPYREFDFSSFCEWRQNHED